MRFVPTIQRNTLYLQALNDGDIIEINDQKFIYNGQNIKGSDINLTKYIFLNITDIYGNMYLSRLFEL